MQIVWRIASPRSTDLDFVHEMVALNRISWDSKFGVVLRKSPRQPVRRITIHVAASGRESTLMTAAEKFLRAHVALIKRIGKQPRISSTFSFLNFIEAPDGVAAVLVIPRTLLDLLHAARTDIEVCTALLSD